MNGLGVRRVAFDDSHAHVAAEFLPLSQRLGLSLADRACLALAKLSGLPAITAERRGANFDAGVEIRLIRHV